MSEHIEFLTHLYKYSRGHFHIRSAKCPKGENIHTSKLKKCETKIELLGQKNLKASLCTYIKKDNAQQKNINEVCAFGLEVTPTDGRIAENLEKIRGRVEHMLLCYTNIPKPSFYISGKRVQLIYIFEKPVRLVPKSNITWIENLQKRICIMMNNVADGVRVDPMPLNSSIHLEDTIYERKHYVGSTVNEMTKKLTKIFEVDETLPVTYHNKTEETYFIKELCGRVYHFEKPRRVYKVSLRPRTTKYEFKVRRLQFLECLIRAGFGLFAAGDNPTAKDVREAKNMCILYANSLVGVYEDRNEAYARYVQFVLKAHGLFVCNTYLPLFAKNYDEPKKYSNKLFIEMLGFKSMEDAIEMGFYVADTASYDREYSKQRRLLEKAKAGVSESFKKRQYYINKVHQMRRSSVARIAKVLHLSESTVRRYQKERAVSIEKYAKKIIHKLREVRVASLVYFPRAKRSHDEVLLFAPLTS